jgi:tRNA threonylcarbamoyladenosine biosynthesis protein TsaB
MNTILAVETSTETCSVALLHQEQILHREITGARRHAESVLVFVDALLSEAGIGKRQLDAIAFGRGPGAFTGVRLAVAVAQGLSFALDIPAIGVSTLKATAWAAMQANAALKAQPLWAVLDARMGEVYAGRFQYDAALAQIVVSGVEVVAKPEALAIDLAREQAVGSGAILFADIFQPKDRNSDRPLLGPNASVIADLARQEPKLRAADAMPVYLRDHVAFTIQERAVLAATKAAQKATTSLGRSI